MRKSLIQVLAVVAMLAVASNAGAQLRSPISIDRYVTASEYWDDYFGEEPDPEYHVLTDKKTAVGVEPFDAKVSLAPMGVYASQKSTITDTSISLLGGFYAWGTVGQFGEAESSSMFSLTEKFILTSPVEYAFRLGYTIRDSYHGGAHASLTGPSGDVFSFANDLYDSGRYDFEVSGTLLPGTYTYSAGAGGAVWLDWADASVYGYEALFTITPEPATMALLLVGGGLLLRRPRVR